MNKTQYVKPEHIELLNTAVVVHNGIYWNHTPHEQHIPTMPGVIELALQLSTIQPGCYLNKGGVWVKTNVLGPTHLRERLWTR